MPLLKWRTLCVYMIKMVKKFDVNLYFTMVSTNLKVRLEQLIY